MGARDARGDRPLGALRSPLFPSGVGIERRKLLDSSGLAVTFGASGGTLQQGILLLGIALRFRPRSTVMSLFVIPYLF